MVREMIILSEHLKIIIIVIKAINPTEQIEKEVIVTLEKATYFSVNY